MELHKALYTTRAMRRVRKDPIPLDVQARIMDAAMQDPSGGNQQNWRFLLLDDPEKKAALAPFISSDAASSGSPSIGSARRGRRQPRCARVDPAPEGATIGPVAGRPLEDVPLFLFSFSQHDPTGGSIYPAVWNTMLAARAEGVGSCLTALLQFFHPAETFEILGVPTDPGLGPVGNGQLRLPDRYVGCRRPAGRPTRSRTATRRAQRRRLRGAHSPMARLGGTHRLVRRDGAALRRHRRRSGGSGDRPLGDRVHEDGARD